ncbi:hypothetical protein Pint_11359 [Pistacia integerrima]|uniref:Uncharacterized protein n=1 Tax=Pistacia integerrima TaxID=434235 RepID=A0ACC0XFD5_9ROSI|nr:hypothetical protein Pint_11359 [Pistacia integerrima]
MFRMGDRVGRPAYNKKKLLLYAIISVGGNIVYPQVGEVRALFRCLEGGCQTSVSSIDPRAPDVIADVFRHLSPHVQACVLDLLKVALTCLDNVTDTDGSLRAMRAKIANFLANNMNQNWPRDLHEKVARSL